MNSRLIFAVSSLLLVSIATITLLLLVPFAQAQYQQQEGKQEQRRRHQQEEEILAAIANRAAVAEEEQAVTSADPTLPPSPSSSTSGDKKHNDHLRRGRQHLQIANETWIWVPFVVLAVFFLFLLSTRKFDIFNKQSFRVFITEYVSLETLYSTLAGADEHFASEQRKCEYGHQFFEFLGCCVLTGNWFFGNGQNQPYVFVLLCLLQIILLWFSLFIDVIMIRFEYLRPVRSVNTKLRFAHCAYQAVLFCVDSIGAEGLASLPLDCYFSAICHYLFEAFGLTVEGLNLIGMSELVLIVIICTKVLRRTENTTTGIVSAFGLTCLSLSCVSIIFSIIYKLRHVCQGRKDQFLAVDPNAALQHQHGHHQPKKKSESHLRESKARLKSLSKFRQQGSQPSAISSLTSAPPSAVNTLANLDGDDEVAGGEKKNIQQRENSM